MSRQLDTLQPAVFRSIKSLMNEGYLTKEEGYRGGEKPIKLTPKGAAAAALLEITHSLKRQTRIVATLCPIYKGFYIP